MNRYFFLLLLIFSGCGQKNSKTVTPLSEKEQRQISESLLNQNLPSPNEILNGTVTYDDKCADFQKKIPSDWITGSLEVPENPEEPQGRKISVFYYGKLEKNKTPVVFFNGGPASSSWNSFTYFNKNKLLVDPEEKVSLIYIDQRGTGCSSYYPQNSEEETLQRLRYYGTRGIVADAEAIRKHLVGDKKWIIFGQSYGAFINHKYAIIAPQSVKASFSHANTISEDPMVRLYERIKSQDRVLKAYIDRYPDDKLRIDLLNNLKTTDCYFNQDQSQKLCGYELIEEILSFLGWTSEWPDLHRWLIEIAPDNEINIEGFKKFLAAFVFTSGNKMTIGNSSRYAERVIAWVDRGVEYTTNKTCGDVPAILLKEGIDIRNNGLTECSLVLQWQDADYDAFAMVRHLKRDLMNIPMFKDALAHNTDLPFYLYSGELDLYVPVESFGPEINALKDLPNFKYKNFLTTGHNGFEVEPELWESLIYEVER